MENRFVEKFRRESIILGSRNANYLNPTVVTGNPDNLKSHLLQIKGNAQGVYFDSHYKEVPSRLTTLKEKQEELAQRWEKHCLDQLKLGNKRPKQMTLEMAEERDKITARTQVAEEEIEWLEQKLQEAEKQKKEARPSLLSAPQHWGSVQLRNSVVISIGPWSVKPDEEGLLRIYDKDSPFFSMPVWRFKSEILKPMGLEFAHRNKQEETEALKLNRPRRRVEYPKPGNWNPQSDLIEYQGYSNHTIKKLKQSE